MIRAAEHYQTQALLAGLEAENKRLRDQVKQLQELEGFTACDMAPAAADGFRDGVASVRPAAAVVMPERKTKTDFSGYIENFQAEASAIYNSALDEVARLNAIDEPVSSNTRGKRERWLSNIRAAIKCSIPRHLRQNLENTAKEIENSMHYGGTKRLRDRIYELEHRLSCLDAAPVEQSAMVVPAYSEEPCWILAGVRCEKRNGGYDGIRCKNCKKLFGCTRAEAAPTPEPASRDWPDGNYYCTCSVCRQQFAGHKRQLVCLLCSEQPAKEQDHE